MVLLNGDFYLLRGSLQSLDNSIKDYCYPIKKQENVPMQNGDFFT